MDRHWVEAPYLRDKTYAKIRAVRKKGGHTLDVYRADEPGDTLTVFQHIRKTAGTSLRNILFTNQAAKMNVVPARDSQEWFEKYWRAKGDGVVCLAGHDANRVVPLTDRPLQLLTLVREPVDRVLSQYYMGGPQTFELDDVPGTTDAYQADRYVNHQAKSLLAPHFDGLPPASPNHPDADLWRDRLLAIADRYLIGVHAHFAESVELFAEELGWTNVWLATAKVNRHRPAVEEVPAATRDALAEANWLDYVLYEHAVRRFT